MIQMEDIDLAYGKQILFAGASLQLMAGERVGLVGRNGHGKTTLFRLILGEIELDGGTIAVPRHYRIGHVAQHLRFTRPTLLEEACLGLLPEEEHDHYKVERILFGLGFTQDDLQAPPASFSGGFQVRLNLAKVLVAQPNLLLLDEPTNYLDIVSIRWIIKFLRQWKNELIVISHDRHFMDSVTTHTAAIHRQGIRKLPGDTTKLYEQIALDESVHEKTRLGEEKQRKHMEAFVTRFRAKASKASAAQARMKMLEKLPQREALKQIASLGFDFHYAPLKAKQFMTVEGLRFGYTPDEILINDLDLTIQSHDRLAIIGKNGRGKSTLLNLLAGELTPNAGTITAHPSLTIGNFGQTNIDRLHAQATVEEEVGQANPTLSRTAVRSICGCMMFSGDHAEKKIQVLSGGERSRVQLGRILAAPANMLLLDEPTNHLDMQSIDALMTAIEAFEGAVVMVTHNEMLLQAFATRLLVFQGGEVTHFDGPYDDFLRRVGWEEEAEARGSSNRPAGSKKAQRQQRAAASAARSKQLGPLETEIKRLEARIVMLETNQQATHKNLVKASEAQDHAAIANLSKYAQILTGHIETAFAQLEAVTKKLDALAQGARHNGRGNDRAQ